MSNHPRILVVQHELDDPLAELAPPLVDAGLEIHPWFTQTDAEPPLPVAEVDGVVSLGAHAGVLDEPDHPWMTRERRLLTDAVQADLPVLGICFGAQLLASVAGARSWLAEDPEIGWTEVEATADAATDPLLASLGTRYPAFQFHVDTFSLPPGATLLGRAGEVVEAFRVGERAWGLQFHIEAGPGVVLGWLGSYREKMGPYVSEEALRSGTAAHWRQYREMCGQVGAAFATVVHAHAAAAAGR